MLVDFSHSITYLTTAKLYLCSSFRKFNLILNARTVHVHYDEAELDKLN